MEGFRVIEAGWRDHAWTFNLIDPDEGVRRGALDRHRALLVAASEALARYNRIWAVTGMSARIEPHLAAELDQARCGVGTGRRGCRRGTLVAAMGW